MNCKQGDIAFHKGGVLGLNTGKIVKCVRLLGHVPGWTGTRWKVEGALIIGTLGESVNHADDAFLIPLRDTDGEDEIIRLVGLPATFSPVT